MWVWSVRFFLLLSLLGVPLSGAYAADWNSLIQSFHQSYQNHDYTQAVNLATEAIRLARQDYGDKHPNYGTALNNMGLVLQAQGRLDEAERHYLSAQKIYSDRLGKNDVDTTSVSTNLAGLYWQQQRVAEALSLFEDIYRIRLQVLGMAHALTITTGQKLQQIYSKLAEESFTKHSYDQARQGWARLSELYGPDDSQSTLSKKIALLERILETYDQEQNIAEALAIQLKIVELNKLRYGAEHPLVAKGMQILADYYRKTKKYDEALHYYDESIRLHEQTLGLAHPENLPALLGLAEIRKDLHQSAQAQRALEQAVQIVEREIDGSQAQFASVFHDLKLIYFEANQQDKVLKLEKRFDSWRNRETAFEGN